MLPDYVQNCDISFLLTITKYGNESKIGNFNVRLVISGSNIESEVCW